MFAILNVLLFPSVGLYYGNYWSQEQVRYADGNSEVQVTESALLLLIVYLDSSYIFRSIYLYLSQL